MEDKEFNNMYAIPANYTDSGKFLNGMLEPRNTIEAIFLVGIFGYPELMWMPVSTAIRVAVMTVTLIPLAVVALMGIAGDSLLQYFAHMTRYWIRRRKLHFRKEGYRNAKTDTKDKARIKAKTGRTKKRSN